MSRYDLSREELATILAGEPRYRGDQVWDGLYRRLGPIMELTDLPLQLRRRLDAEPGLATALSVDTEVTSDSGATRKWLFRLDDGDAIETVLMHYRHHSTVCVSSQAGCAMGCTFCATGQGGYRRHLRSGEILEQVARATEVARDDNRRLDHVVFMGMGEPFANFDNVWTAIERIVADFGLAARHVTVSTVGLVPGINRLSTKDLQVNLAVSLHAANDALRNTLVPINRRYPLTALLQACEEYFDRTHRRISFEWAMIDGVNDGETDAYELAGLAHRVGAHVNLIPLNPTPQGGALGQRGSSPARVAQFCAWLRHDQVNATVRQTRGREIDAACGQLAGTALGPTRH